MTASCLVDVPSKIGDQYLAKECMISELLDKYSPELSIIALIVKNSEIGIHCRIRVERKVILDRRGGRREEEGGSLEAVYSKFETMDDKAECWAAESCCENLSAECMWTEPLRT